MAPPRIVVESLIPRTPDALRRARQTQHLYRPPTFPRTSSSFLFALPLILVSLLPAQQPTPGNPPDPSLQGIAAPSHSPLFREIDLLRRDGFSTARQATLSLHLLDRSGQSPARLNPGDFKLFVNGTERPARLQPPGQWTAPAPPLVLLVFPPNQPILHSLAIAQATKYFAAQPRELLSWKVALLDSDGSSTAYTDGRSQLLAWLQVSDHKTQPFQYSQWRPKAESSIATMSTYPGPTILIAFNPLPGPSAGLHEAIFEYGGPETLIAIAQSIGARIYIANVGGPNVFVPRGDAAADSSRSATRAYNLFAFRNSVVRQTADETLGGFSNSLKDLATQIHHDLDDNYGLTFDLTAQDRDKGVPEVDVRLNDPHRRVIVANLYPVKSPVLSEPKSISKELMASMRKTADHPVASADFRITQHIDYFPLRDGLQPILPMSAVVEWIGPGPAPAQLSVAEYVQNVSLAIPVLEREVEARWAGRGISWERDGHLYPGKYLWRVVLHDDSGRIVASSDQTISVGTPPNASLAVSSLVVGKSCRDQQPNASPMRKRADLTPEERDTAHLTIDPMQAAGCRLKPEPTSLFFTADSLHAFLRIYPSGKLKKLPPESWSASFSIRSASGAIELQQDLPFTIDSGSGFLASTELALNSPEVHPGPHTLQIDVKGPGIRKDLIATRQIDIAQQRSALGP